jgi:exopolysaccharide biosynthesis predicted pyruvyltransferase EpsI
VHSEVVPDLTFLVKRNKTGAPSSTVLATDSVNSEVTREMRRISSERNWNFTRLIHSSRPRLSDGWTTKEFLRRNAKWLYASVLGKNTKNKDQFLDYLMSHRLICTARFHAVTLSFATKTPFVAVESNTPKISNMVRDVLGETERVVKLSEVDKIDPAKYAWTEKEINLVSEYLTSAQKSCDAMFDDIVASLKQSARNAA